MAKSLLPPGIDAGALPAHVGVIMDGNGRWAKSRGLPRAVGHRAGVENVRVFLRASSDWGIKYVTLFAFSTENWKRPGEEVGFLMKLLLEYMKSEVDELDRQNVKILTLGDIDSLPSAVAEAIYGAMDKTALNTGLTACFAMNYGSRRELARAASLIAKDAAAGKIAPIDVDEAAFSRYLYTGGLPDPDLIIRTSGETRLSNFLLYQAAYAEYIFTDTLWPDFDESSYARALVQYQKRERRFGGV